MIFVHLLGLCLKIEASYMQISEASARANCGNLIIPCGENKNNGLELFRATVAEFKRTLSVFFPPRQVFVFFHFCSLRLCL